MAKYMEIKSKKPKLKQSETAKLLELPSSTKKRYRREIKRLSPYRIPPSSKTNHTRKQKTPNMNIDDVKVTSNDLKTTSNELEKNKLKGSATIANNEKYLDENIHICYL